jgi:hypothetical protein
MLLGDSSTFCVLLLVFITFIFNFYLRIVLKERITFPRNENIKMAANNYKRIAKFICNQRRFVAWHKCLLILKRFSSILCMLYTHILPLESLYLLKKAASISIG